MIHRHDQIKRLCILLVGGFGPSVLINPAWALDFHSYAGQYNIELPDGWVQIPPQVLYEVKSQFIGKDNPLVGEFVGFQLSAADRWMAYPYVLVQRIEYRSMGLVGQLDEAAFKAFVAQMTGLEPEALAGGLTEEGKRVLNHAEFGIPRLEKEKRRYVWSTTFDVPELGSAHSLIVGYFGARSVVQVMFCTFADEAKVYEETARAITDSFSFDEGGAYRTAAAASGGSISMQYGFLWSTPMLWAYFGAGVGLLVLLVGRLLRRQEK